MTSCCKSSKLEEEHGADTSCAKHSDHEHKLEHLDSSKQKERETQYMSASIDEEARHAKVVLPDLDTMAPIKLVALDLDGTTLREDKTFSPRLIEAIKKVQERGITVAICSGRAPESVQEFAHILKLDEGTGYCVCFNGGAIINLKEITKDLYVSTINAYDLIDIEELASEHECVVHAYSTRRVLLTESNMVFTEMEIAASMQPFEQLLFPDEVDVNERAYKLIAVGDADKLDEVRANAPADFAERFNIARTHPNFLEFMAKGCSKGSALSHLCEILGITMENVVAFGDAENDIEMVRDCGVGVAVGNAMPTLKAVTKYSTLHYMDDGVAVYLEKLLNL